MAFIFCELKKDEFKFLQAENSSKNIHQLNFSEFKITSMDDFTFCKLKTRELHFFQAIKEI